MSEGRADSERARELADELRAIVEALSVTELEAPALARASKLARALRRQLSGTRQPRWYDTDAGERSRAEASQRAYLDQSPVRGQLNPLAPPLSIESVEEADGSRSLRGRARLGMAYEGPPYAVHGGWVAALFDELLGATQRLTRVPGLTASLRVKYRHPTPLEETLEFRGWIQREQKHFVIARATCHAGDTLTAEAEAMFLRVNFDALQKQMRKRREST